MDQVVKSLDKVTAKVDETKDISEGLLSPLRRAWQTQKIRKDYHDSIKDNIRQKVTRMNIDSRNRITDPKNILSNNYVHLKKDPLSFKKDSREIKIECDHSHNLESDSRIILQSVKPKYISIKGGIELVSSSNYIKINIVNHGITKDLFKYSTQKIQITGIIGTSRNNSYIGNIPISVLNRVHEIHLTSNVDSTGSPDYFYIKIKEFIIGVKDGFKSIHGLENKAIFWAHTLLIWIMYLMMTYICFFSIEATQMLTLVDGLYAMIIGGYGMVAPVQGGIGAYHYIVKEGLMLISISEDSALLFATIVHTAQTLMTLSVGGISILMVFLSKRKATK